MALLRPFLVLILLLAATPAFAVEPGERLADPALEFRARELSKGLRCLVCRNESIDESGADLAHDVRIFLRERLVGGDSDAQAVQAIVGRYGDYVLLQPPVNKDTLVLWFGPPALLVIAAGALLLTARRRRVETVVPLTAAERLRVDAMIRETES
jgi:cytochrome c-type biogenesis protein CcmH